MIFFERKIGQSLGVDGWSSLLQFTQKEGLQQVLFLFLASTVVARRASRQVFSNISKLLTVKTTNNRFFCIVHSCSVYQKYLSPLLTTLSWFSIYRWMKSSNLWILIEFLVYKLFNIFVWDKRIYVFYDNFCKTGLSERFCSGAARKDIVYFFL